MKTTEQLINEFLSNPENQITKVEPGKEYASNSISFKYKPFKYGRNVQRKIHKLNSNITARNNLVNELPAVAKSEMMLAFPEVKTIAGGRRG